MTTVAAALLEELASRGVQTVFGVPGNHTVALYRHLGSCGLQHVTCRHEQGAAFMADGYARVSGMPGVCLLISGPGLLNAATAIAQARADSIPLLVISAVAAVADLGMGRGTLHELPDQRGTAASFCISSSTLLDPANLAPLIDRAFAFFATARPGPVHIEIPLDLMEAEIAPATSGAAPPGTATRLGPPGPDTALIAAAASMLEAARAHAILVGGGAVGAAPEIVELAERLDAPVFNTVNGKGICPADHPLAVGGSPSLPAVRDALAAADVVLAAGTEMSETDYDLLMLGPPSPHPGLIRLDIDASRLLVPHPPAVAIATDARLGVRALLAALGPEGAARGGAARAAALRESVRREPHYHPEMQSFLDVLVRAAPDAVIVGDSARPTYYASWQLDRAEPRTYFHSASGFGTLGFALPAAFGAALGSERPVMALIGDGGVQFTLPELTTGAELGLPVPVIVWHNDGYREIEHSMRARNIPADATRILAPDFEAAARAHHARYARPTTLADLERALSEALAADGPTLVEVREGVFLTTPSGGWY